MANAAVIASKMQDPSTNGKITFLNLKILVGFTPKPPLMSRITMDVPLKRKKEMK